MSLCAFKFQQCTATTRMHGYTHSVESILRKLVIPKTIDLEYVFRRAIFGAGMGRDDGHYCDVQSSGVNLFLIEGSQLLFHPLVIYHL